MRALFATYGFSGHLKPLVPLGWALRAAGHEVVVASHPYFARTITGAGLPALPAGPEFDLHGEVSRDAAEHDGYRRQLAEVQAAGRVTTGVVRLADGTVSPALRGRSAGPAGQDDSSAAGRRSRTAARLELPGLRPAVRSADVMADDLVAFARWWRPDIVVFEPLAFAGPLVARVLGVPAVRVLWTADFTVPLEKFESALFGELLERLGLPALGLNGDLTLDPCPPMLQVDDGFPRQLMRYVPYNGTTVLPAWLREPPRRRRICVCWGTSVTVLSPGRMASAPAAVQAMADLDADVVLAVLESQLPLLGTLPSNVIAAGPVALDLLLPTCDALIHHGGGGTLMTGLVHGVPQVIVPYIPDTCFNAIQLAKTGAARAVWAEDATAAELRRAAAVVLGVPGCREAARSLRAQMLSQPTPADTVPTLERLASGG